MTERLRFHLDECVDPTVAVGLRAHGIEVTTTLDAGLRTANDETQIDFAIRERRVLVTHDDDFLRTSRAYRHPGIAFCRQGALDLGEMIRWLRLLHGAMQADEMRDHVEYGFPS